MQLLPEPRGELSATVRNNPLRNSMQTNNPRNIKIGKLISSVGGPYWDKVSNLGESVHYNPDSIVTTVRLRKYGDKIHSNFIPLPLGNLEGLQ